MGKVNISEKLSLIEDHWNPRIAAELNGQHVRLVKIQGEFVWHKHDNEDEMFYVLRGKLEMRFRDKTVLYGCDTSIVRWRGRDWLRRSRSGGRQTK